MQDQLLKTIIEKTLSQLTPEEAAGLIDNTLLSPRTTIPDALRLIEETARYGFNCAMIPSALVYRVYDAAKSLGTRLCTVIGFPLGAVAADSKRAEILTVSSYVEEIDIVAPIWAAESGNYDYLVEELKELVTTAKEHDIGTVKIIVTAPLVSDNVLAMLVEASAKAGADYVKTSTGVYSKGGDPRTVLRLSELAEKYGLKVKAAGGIRTAIDMILALASGAHRIGTSAGVRILEDYKRLYEQLA